MKKLLYLFLIAATIACSGKRNYSIPAIYSNNVKDSFELYVDLPAGYKKNDSDYSVAFYMDANLKMGNEIRRQIKLEENKENLDKVIFVGIGHIGSYRTLRRRDFIPPVIKDGASQQSTDPDFGHADQFYQFLTNELIPYINQHYPNNRKYTYIGHSFSGLFAFYCMFQLKPVFKNYIALSPSLWVNYNNFFEYENQYHAKNPTLNVSLYHACGTGEWANKVLSTSRNMNQTLMNRQYQDFKYTYVEHEGKNHNGVVPVSIKYILKHTAF